MVAQGERSENVELVKGGQAEGSEAKAGGEKGRRSPGGSSLSNVPTPSRGGRSSRNVGGGAKARGPASALEDLMRKKGVDEAWSALEDMQRQGITTDKYTVSRMLMKTVGDGRTRLNPPRVYRGIALVERFIEMQPKDIDEVLFNALLDTCCRLKDLGRLEANVTRMRELNIKPSPVTLGILVKTYGQAGDLQKVLQVWSEMEKQRDQANAVTYGCMIDACVKCGNLEKAVEIFKGMQASGKHRNTILYTTLIKGYGQEKDLENALRLFREMPGEGVPYNTITFNSIMDACVKCGDLPTAESLLREMTAPGSSLEPDLITFSTLLKGYCHVGEIDKALQVVEAIKARGLRCDELVYNTLMDGCVKANDITAGVGLFEEMMQAGMRPSTITHSILARLHQRAGYEDDASARVAQLYQHHGVEPPSGSDRGGRGGARRWSQQSPGGRVSERSNQSPMGSPGMAQATTTGLGLHGEVEGAVWGGAWGHGFDGSNASAPSTPLTGSLQGSPAQSGGLFLPFDALRGSPVPPLPGTLDGSPYSQASCSPMGSMPPSPWNGAFTPMGSMPPTPANQQQQQQFFSAPASPQSMQPGFGVVAGPYAAFPDGTTCPGPAPPMPAPTQPAPYHMPNVDQSQQSQQSQQSHQSQPVAYFTSWFGQAGVEQQLQQMANGAEGAGGAVQMSSMGAHCGPPQYLS